MRDIGHPDTHGRVDGKIFDAREGLSFFENGKRRFFELKDVGSNETVRTGGENPLTICVGHGREDSREPGWRLVAGRAAGVVSPREPRATAKDRGWEERL